jgi:hypothetical protein
MQYAKAMKEIRKQKRKREEKRKNIEKGLGEPFGPLRGTSPQPRK